jgi:hypothetical protein
MSSPSVDAEVRRFAQILEAIVRQQGSGKGLRVGVRGLERKMEWGAGTLSRVLKGQIDLKLRHVLDVLEALDFPAERFFQLAYEARRRESEGPLAEGMLGFLEARGLKAEPEILDKEEDAIPDDELDQRIQRALLRYGLTPPQADERKKS